MAGGQRFDQIGMLGKDLGDLRFGRCWSRRREPHLIPLGVILQNIGQVLADLVDDGRALMGAPSNKMA
jgi:hypothetical protein